MTEEKLVFVGDSITNGGLGGVPMAATYPSLFNGVNLGTDGASTIWYTDDAPLGSLLPGVLDELPAHRVYIMLGENDARGFLTGAGNGATTADLYETRMRGLCGALLDAGAEQVVLLGTPVSRDSSGFPDPARNELLSLYRSRQELIATDVDRVSVGRDLAYVWNPRVIDYNPGDWLHPNTEGHGQMWLHLRRLP